MLRLTTVVLDSSPIQYHQICLKNRSLLCFRDDVYLCICADSQTRVECFRYDSELARCSLCLSGGRCFRGDPNRANDFVCLCPECYSGRQCQFSTTSFTFNLDQLFYTDLTSRNKRATIAVLIVFSVLAFFFTLPNNVFSLFPLRRRSCLRNGVGHYLFSLSVINQISVTLLMIRLIHLCFMASAMFQSRSNLDNVLRKFFSYSLTCCVRLAYWFTSFVSVERVYTTIFFNKRWLKQPHVARRLMVLTFCLVFLTSPYELVFIKAFADVDKGHGSMCVMEFPMTDRSMWITIHQFVFVTHLLVPLLSNICCAITIITIVIKTKMRLRGQHERKLFSLLSIGVR